MHVFPFQAEDSIWSVNIQSSGSFFTPALPTSDESLASPSPESMDAADTVPTNVANIGKSRQVLNLQSKTKQIRRGVGKGKRNPLQFSLFGNNVNGIKGKLDSLMNTLKHFKYPCCITLQESKLKGTNIKISGYQIFLKIEQMEGEGG